MISWFDAGEWLAGYIARVRQTEARQAVEYAAKLLGADATFRGEDALISTPPYGLLFYIGGPDLQAYCCIYDERILDLQAAKRLHFHQHGEPLRRNSWIWFARMSEDGVTSYKIEKRDRRYAWIITRVMPAVETRIVAENRRDAIVSIGVRIASDFQAYQQKLASIPPQERMTA